jgi:hypothetical protein
MTISEILKAKGLDDATIAGILEDMKTNKVFAASEENLDIRYGKLKTEHEGVTKQLGEATTLIEELKKSSKGNEGLQQKISDYEGQVAALQAELEQTRLDSAIKVELLSSKALDVDYLTFKLKEKGELSLDENGKVKGWEDKLAALKTQFPTQFETTSSKHYEEFRLPDSQGNGDNTVTREEFNRMGYNARVELRRNNPEQYTQLMKG